jgi:ABC-type multidrug transport system ATPase subunit
MGMRVTLSDVAKQFAREKVFTGVDHVFEAGSRTALLGPNGSGKSTLLQVVAGALMPTKGTVEHALGGSSLQQEQVYRHVSIAAPYLDLYEDLSLRETLETHARFKPFLAGETPTTLAKTAFLEKHLEKPVSNFSSGMKQRLKLALASSATHSYFCWMNPPPTSTRKASLGTASCCWPTWKAERCWWRATGRWKRLLLVWLRWKW